MESIKIQTTINESINKVWECYTDPEHVTKWNNASEDWHTPSAENDLRISGKFLYRMESVDRSEGFDFTGTYTNVEENRVIAYAMDDGREVEVTFDELGENTQITVIFAPESENPIEMQKQGWQAILDNFKKYVENLKNS